VVASVALGCLVACGLGTAGSVDAGGLGLDGEPPEPPAPAPTCDPVPPLTPGSTNIPLIVGTGAQRVDGVGEGEDAKEGEGFLDGAFVFRGARALEPTLAIRCPGVSAGGECAAKSALAFEDASGAVVEIAVGFARAELPAIEDGAAVHVRYDGGLVITREVDGALLLALPQVRWYFGFGPFEPGLRVEAGPLVLEPVSGCKVGPDWCNRTFQLRTLRVSVAAAAATASGAGAAGDAVYVPHGESAEVVTAAGRFRITNHMLFERTPTGNGMPECADEWAKHFLVDVVRLDP
jgi:hypothetical protein